MSSFSNRAVGEGEYTEGGRSLFLTFPAANLPPTQPAASQLASASTYPGPRNTPLPPSSHIHICMLSSHPTTTQRLEQIRVGSGSRLCFSCFHKRRRQAWFEYLFPKRLHCPLLIYSMP
jgi:hypothetical protein